MEEGEPWVAQTGDTLHGQGNPLVLLMAIREAPLADHILTTVELDVRRGFGPIYDVTFWAP